MYDKKFVIFALKKLFFFAYKYHILFHFLLLQIIQSSVLVNVLKTIHFIKKIMINFYIMFNWFYFFLFSDGFIHLYRLKQLRNLVAFCFASSMSFENFNLLKVN